MGRSTTFKDYYRMSFRTNRMFERIRVLDDYIAFPIKEISSIKFAGTVYNVETSSDTYLISNATVHNCHPRDNWALWWLSEKLDLSTNIFEFVMDSRYKQAEWLADLLASYELPIVILGARYKPNTNLTTASASLLVKEILERDYPELKVTIFDPFFGRNVFPDDEKLVYFISHKFEFIEYLYFPEGSIVVDPWGWLKEKHPEKIKDVEYVSIGRKEMTE